MLDSQTQLLARYMDLLVVQQRITGTNIANADTPGYKTRRLDFAWEFRRALDQPSSRMAASWAIPFEGGLTVNNDGNDVSLDRELRVLAETGIRYTLAAQRIRGNLRSLRDAIREGRGP